MTKIGVVAYKMTCLDESSTLVPFLFRLVTLQFTLAFILWDCFRFVSHLFILKMTQQSKYINVIILPI